MAASGKLSATFLGFGGLGQQGGALASTALAKPDRGQARSARGHWKTMFWGLRGYCVCGQRPSPVSRGRMTVTSPQQGTHEASAGSSEALLEAVLQG